jgi:hypothetical protein
VPVSGAAPKRDDPSQDRSDYEPSVPRAGGIAIGGGGNSNRRPDAYELDELADRLQEVTKGKPRYDSSDEKGQAPVGSGAGRPPPARSVNNAPLPRDDAFSDDEDESNEWGRGGASNVNAEDEDEDMLAREEELKAELNMATMRCDELKKTLEVTKSFIGDVKAVSIKAPYQPIGNPDRGQDVSRRPPPIIANESDTDEFDDAASVGSLDDMEDSWGPANLQPVNQAIKQQDDSVMVTPRKVREPSEAVKESPYYNLQDPPTPSGRLSDRIELLKQRCIEALGRDAFRDAYNYLKQSNNYDLSDNRGLYEDDLEEEKMSRIRSILGEGKAHYMSLIEQLIFMEDTHL